MRRKLNHTNRPLVLIAALLFSVASALASLIESLPNAATPITW